MTVESCKLAGFSNVKVCFPKITALVVISLDG